MRLRSIALLAVSGLLIAACGGGGSESADSSPTTPAPPVTPPETQPTTQPTEPPPATPAPTEPAPVDTQPPVTDPPEPSSVVMASPDGDLMIEVDRADNERISPSVGILDPADWPPEVAGAANLPGVTLYDLQPAGATFDTPVLITRRLDAANIPDLGPLDLPIVTMLTHSDGAYELLDDLAVVRFGDDIYVSGTTTHFSGALASSEGSSIQLNPNLTISGFIEASMEVQDLDLDDAEFDLDVAELDFEFNFDDDLVIAGGMLGSVADSEFDDFDPFQPTIEVEATVDIAQRLASLFDEETGVGYGAAATTFEVPISDAPSAAQLLGEAIDAELDTFEYQAWAFLMTVPDEFYEDALDLVDEMRADLEDDIEFVVEVFHEAFGEYPSYTRRRYRGLPAIPSGLSGYSALFEGEVDDPRLVSVSPFETDGDDWVAESGIECFCEYGEMLFFFDADDEQLVKLLDSPAGYEQFWVFAGANTDAVRMWVVTDAETGDVRKYQVGPEQGQILGDYAAFATVP